MYNENIKNKKTQPHPPFVPSVPLGSNTPIEISMYIEINPNTIATTIIIRATIFLFIIGELLTSMIFITTFKSLR